MVSLNRKYVKNYHELQKVKVSFRPVNVMGISAKNSKKPCRLKANPKRAYILAEFGGCKWRRKYRVERCTERECDERTVLGQCDHASSNYSVHGYFRDVRFWRSLIHPREEREVEQMW